MKALRTLAAVVLLIGAMTMNAQSMSIAAMRDNARFLTDRMAYTLGIRDPYLIDEIYRINYDYIWGVNDYLDDVAMGYYYDEYMVVVAARDAALRNLLGYNAWNRLMGYSYFYRPIVFANYGWRFSIYDYDRYGVRRFYFAAPRPIAHYTGGHFFRPMPPRGGHMAPPPPAPAPRGGIAPRGGMAPRGGGAPAPNGAYRGQMHQPGHPQAQPRGQMQPQQHAQPQMNQRGQMLPQGGGQTQMNQRGQMNQPQMQQRQNQPQMQQRQNQPQMQQRNVAPRSNGNMGSSSSSSGMMTTRVQATPAHMSSGGTRGSGAIRGGRR